MANVNSLSSNSYSSASSIYGSRNVLTGLASGMDTETMIENSVTGFQTKIAELQQSQTKLEWKQDAFRDIIGQMNSIVNKYTSFSSATNLASNNFFTSNVTTETKGANADAISATGSTKSDIRINQVEQLATATRYAVSAEKLDINADNRAVGAGIDWSKQEKVGQISGTLSLKYGSKTIDLKFDESDTGVDTAEGLQRAIEKKLAAVTISVKNGTVSADSLISVKAENGTFTFAVDRSNKNDDGSAVYINSISGNLATTLGASKPASTLMTDKVQNNSFTVGNFENLVKTPSMAEYLSGKTLDVTLDGVTKQLKISDLTASDKTISITGEDGTTTEKAISALSDGELAAHGAELSALLAQELQTAADKAFGAGKLTVAAEDGGLSFDVKENSGSSVSVSSGAGEALGIGKSGVSNYFNTTNTLEKLVGKDWLNANARMKPADGKISAEAKLYDADGNQVKRHTDGNFYLVDDKGEFITKNGKMTRSDKQVAELYSDSQGNLVRQDSDGSYYRVNTRGEALYEMEINGTKIGGFTADTALERVLNVVNSNTDVGVNVSYSRLTGQFVFTARNTGEGNDITFGDGLAQKLFGVKNTPENKTVESVFGDSIQWDDEGKANIVINSAVTGMALLGEFHKDDSLDKLMDALNKVKNGALEGWFSFDEQTGRYSLTSKNGADYDTTYKDRIALFSPTQRDKQISLDTIAERAASEPATLGFEKTMGQDAVVHATVNGKDLSLRRSSNVVEMDGLSVTLKEEFDAHGEDGTVKASDAVTFKTSSNADAIVEAVRSFVEDVNKLMTGVHDAFATQPLKKSSTGVSTKRDGYEPLTESDKADMSEEAVKNYEEKAKTGLLFGDTDLRTLYDKLLGSIQSFGGDRVDMESIGLTTTYSGGVTTFSLNETKLRAALESNPDKVRTVFTKTTETSESGTNGLMQSLKQTLNAYGSTSLGSPGILVKKAGTKLSAVSLLNNNLQSQIDIISKQIESWQTKLGDRVDYYTKQFTQLEKLMSTMNNQSSMLSDLMGY